MNYDRVIRKGIKNMGCDSIGEYKQIKPVRSIEVKRRIRCVFTLGLFLCVVMLSGCMDNIENVEQRDYATFLMVSLPEEGEGYHYTAGIAKEHRVGEKGEAEDLFQVDAGSIAELMKEYGAYKGKDLSLSHLKVILTADDIVDGHSGIKEGDYKGNGSKEGVNKYRNKLTAFTRLLWELDNEEQVAKTCPVLLVPDITPVTKYLKNAQEPIGTYITDLIKNAERNDRNVPKLMDYLKLLREGKRLDAYGICVNEDYLYIEYECRMTSES